MKKHKDNRHRPGPKATANALASARGGAAWPRRIGWLAGVGVLLLLGLFGFDQYRNRIETARAGGTNHLSKPAGDLEPRSSFATARQAPGTKGLGTVVNRESEGGAVSGAEFTPHARPGAVVDRQKEAQASDLNSQAKQALDAGDTKRAVQLFEQASALLPMNETLHFNLGIAFTAAGDPTNAENEYKEALRLLPDYPEAHYKYGDLLVRIGHLPEAEEHLAAAVEQLPESAEVQNSLGVARQRRKKTNEALLSFQRAVECDSNFWEAHYNLALAYLNRNNREKEIAELRQTLRINPGFEPAQRALARATLQGTPNLPAEAADRR
ncbi:MAG: tetratricopeptide repeat protein [Limisphaerales bacterium]